MNMNNSSYRVVTKSGHMATSIVSALTPLVLEISTWRWGSKMFRRARPGQSAEKEVWFSVFRCLSVRHKLLRRLYFLSKLSICDGQTDI